MGPRSVSSEGAGSGMGEELIDEAAPIWLRTILSQHSQQLGDECASRKRRFKQSTNIHPIQGANPTSTLYSLHPYILVIVSHISCWFSAYTVSWRTVPNHVLSLEHFVM